MQEPSKTKAEQPDDIDLNGMDITDRNAVASKLMGRRKFQEVQIETFESDKLDEEGEIILMYQGQGIFDRRLFLCRLVTNGLTIIYILYYTIHIHKYYIHNMYYIIGAYRPILCI